MPITSPLAAPVEVYLDCETGGLRPTDRPWEIALLRCTSDGRIEQYVWQVLDFWPSKADPTALQLSGFYDRHQGHAIYDEANPLNYTPDGDQAVTHPAWNASGPDPDLPVTLRCTSEMLVALELERLVRGAVVWACNPVYDVPRLEALLNRAGRAWTAHYRPMCATTWAAATATALGLTTAAPPFSNAKIGEALGVSRDGYGTAHTGLADCYYAKALVDAARALVPAVTSA